MNRQFIFGMCILMAGLLLMHGCKSKRSLTVRNTYTGEDRLLIEHVINHQSMPDRFEIKAKGKISMGDQSFGGIITCRFRGNDEVWASVRSSIGIEIARVYADKDSVWMNSRLFRMKEKGTWESLRKMIGMPLNMSILRAVLSRSMEEVPVQAWQNIERWVLDQREGDQWMTVKGVEVESELGYETTYRVEQNNYPIMEMWVEDLYKLWRLQVVYGGDQGRRMDRLMIEGMDSKNEIQADLQVVSFEENNDLEMPFAKF